VRAMVWRRDRETLSKYQSAQGTDVLDPDSGFRRARASGFSFRVWGVQLSGRPPRNPAPRNHFWGRLPNHEQIICKKLLSRVSLAAHAKQTVE